MQLISEQIEEAFMPLLQHEVKFMHHNKTLKKGKILLVSKKGSYISFILSINGNEPKVYDLPYPFAYEYVKDSKQVKLSYKIKDLCNDKQIAIDMVKELIPEKPGRFFEKNINIICVDS
tara:strand:+ start:1299 stop:1655 length:357 start_codon:yes stop_codon:yes gene_type:complete